MSRYIGPKTRINRRFSQAIFAPNKAFERKPYLPGIHGPKLRRKVTPYSIGLLAKQVGRYTYGLTEKQFYLTFQKAKRKKGVTGDLFLQALEMRLDNVVYRMGLAKTRRAARQFVNHGHIKVNGGKVDIASYSCAPGDKIEVHHKPASRQLATANWDFSIPNWLTVSIDTLSGTVNRAPSTDELDPNIDRQLIVEFYSR
jgi:small subunit ribosomal protein S4